MKLRISQRSLQAAGQTPDPSPIRLTQVATPWILRSSSCHCLTRMSLTWSIPALPALKSFVEPEDWVGFLCHLERSQPMVLP